MSVQVPKPDHCIDLGVGQPDPALLPTALFSDLAVGWQDLAYGEHAGDRGFRQHLARWLSGEYQTPVEPQQLFVTTGSSGGLDMICSRLARPGDVVLVEEPSYFLALMQLVEHGLKPVAVPMDRDGLEPAALEQAIRQHRPAFIYSIPTYHNPTGITQPRARREALVALARQYDCPLVADEVYQCLYFAEPPPPPLACFDPQAPVLSIGSFSKILAPGLRLGWLHGSGEVLGRLLGSALLKSGGGLAPVTSALVNPLIEQGALQSYIAGLRQTFRARRDCLHDSLSAALGGQLELNRPDGGYFLWAHLRDGRDIRAHEPRCRALGVAVKAGPLFSVRGGFRSSLRLCFAWYDEAQLRAGAERLARALDGGY